LDKRGTPISKLNRGGRWEIKKLYALAEGLCEGTRVRWAHAEKLVTRGLYLGERELQRDPKKGNVSESLLFSLGIGV